jgi:hypothetical protein
VTDGQETSVKLTALQRAIAEAQGLANRGDFDALPSSDGALRSMSGEFKALRKKVTLLYVVTTIRAFFILSHTNSDASVSIFGISVPLSLLSKQALSILLAGAFAYYAGAVVSAAMLYGTMAAIVRRAAPESWEFLLSRYDADQLWTNLLIPKKLGAPSPWSEIFLAGIVSFGNRAVVGAHIALVWGAVISAMMQATKEGGWFGIALSGLALLAVLCATIGAVGAVFVRLTYTLPQAPKQ